MNGARAREAAPASGSTPDHAVFAIHDDGRVRWHPAIDVNRVILGGQLVAATALVMLGPLLGRWLVRRLPA